MFKTLGEYINDLIANQVPPVDMSPALQPEDMHFHIQPALEAAGMRIYCVSPCRPDDITIAFDAN